MNFGPDFFENHHPEPVVFGLTENWLLVKARDEVINHNLHRRSIFVQINLVGRIISLLLIAQVEEFLDSFRFFSYS